MLIKAKVITRSKQENIEKLPDGSYKIRVRVAAERGRANERVREMVAQYFKRPISVVMIVKGQTSSRKIIEVI